MGENISRREFLQAGSLAILGATAAGAGVFPRIVQAQHTRDNWNPGDLTHLIPIVNQERIFIKTSFKVPLKQAPRLKVGARSEEGLKSDTLGRFWKFDVRGLEAGKEYELRIVDGSGSSICDPWPLRTFPVPSAYPGRLRILAFT